MSESAPQLSPAAGPAGAAGQTPMTGAPPPPVPRQLHTAPQLKRKRGRPKGSGKKAASHAPSNTPKSTAAGAAPNAQGAAPASAPGAAPKPRTVKFGIPVSEKELASALAKYNCIAVAAAQRYAPALLPAAQKLGWCGGIEGTPEKPEFLPSKRATMGAELIFPLAQSSGWLEFELSAETAFLLGCGVLIAPAIPALVSAGLDFAFPHRAAARAAPPADEKKPEPEKTEPEKKESQNGAP